MYWPRQIACARNKYLQLIVVVATSSMLMSCKIVTIATAHDHAVFPIVVSQERFRQNNLKNDQFLALDHQSKCVGEQQQALHCGVYLLLLLKSASREHRRDAGEAAASSWCCDGTHLTLCDKFCRAARSEPCDANWLDINCQSEQQQC
eukprot:10255-Heterococcus_DN1.PRE.3